MPELLKSQKIEGGLRLVPSQSGRVFTQTFSSVKAEGDPFFKGGPRYVSVPNGFVLDQSMEETMEARLQRLKAAPPAAVFEDDEALMDYLHRK